MINVVTRYNFGNVSFNNIRAKNTVNNGDKKINASASPKGTNSNPLNQQNASIKYNKPRNQIFGRFGGSPYQLTQFGGL